MTKRILVMIAVIASLVAMETVAPADVPQLISFQGKLYDGDENPLTGEYEVTFRIYDIDEGGSALWSETKNVICEDGLYAVILGQTNPVALDFDGQYWLGVQVTGDDELTPRYRLVSVPTAFRAQVADEVSWTNLTDVPAGFADGTDDVGAAGGVSQIDAGAGITVTDPTGPIATVAADIGPDPGQVAAGNHTHHSLDAADSNPTGAVYVDDNGNVGIGTETPGLFIGALRYLTFSSTDTYGPDRTVSLELQGASASLFTPVAKIDFSSRGLSESNNIARIEVRRGGTVSKGTMVFSTNDGTSLTERFRIREDGNVGIGTDVPLYKLDVNGTIRGDNVAPSDVRLKTDIITIDNALEKVVALRGTTFRWKDERESEALQMGLIAQEVEAVFPEAVSTDDVGYKSVAYGKLIAPLIEAVKELKVQNDYLKTENESLKRRVEKLEREIVK